MKKKYRRVQKFPAKNKTTDFQKGVLEPFAQI